MTRKDDPVPRLPPRLLGYRHTSPEFYDVSSNDALPTPNDITRFEGIDNRQGNEKDLGFDTTSHVRYFGAISSCSPDGIEI